MAYPSCLSRFLLQIMGLQLPNYVPAGDACASSSSWEGAAAIHLPASAAASRAVVDNGMKHTIELIDVMMHRIPTPAARWHKQQVMLAASWTWKLSLEAHIGDALQA